MYTSLSTTISSANDSLWKVAYGQEPTLFEKQDLKSSNENVIKNKAAALIIEGHKKNYLLGRAVTIVTIVLLVLAASVIAFYFLKPEIMPISAAEIATGGGLLSLLGVGVGGFAWYLNKKRLKEDMNSKLSALVSRLGDDLTSVQQRFPKNAFDAQQYQSDWQKLFTALSPNKKS